MRVIAVANHPFIASRRCSDREIDMSGTAIHKRDRQIVTKIDEIEIFPIGVDGGDDLE